jgi:polyketide cyclase/dehydrase/lipid transport protein
VPDLIVEEKIEASPLAVYELVSDVTNMGRWSPETTACRWLRGATGPAVGARFKGANRDRWRRWSTTCTVVSADPGRMFAFDVKFWGIPVARWAYEFAPEATGAASLSPGLSGAPAGCGASTTVS